MIRERLFPLLWGLLWPVRFFVTRSPFRLGKSLVEKTLLHPLLPPAPRTFTARLQFGTSLQVQYRETIGLGMLLNGSFESPEIEALCSATRPGSTVIDVGANIGIYTVVLARAVGPSGQVLAFEPVPENVERLRRNLEVNDIANVEVFQVAIADRNETVALHLSDDPAYHSTVAVSQGHGLGRSTTVPGRSLNKIWRELGSPEVSVAKIDVEGAELDVLRGATEILATCRPALLIEITTPSQLSAITELLSPYEYRSRQPEGFMDWNYLFTREQS